MILDYLYKVLHMVGIEGVAQTKERDGFSWVDKRDKRITVRVVIEESQEGDSR